MNNLLHEIMGEMYHQVTPPTSWYSPLPSNGLLDIFLKNEKTEQLGPITKKVKPIPIDNITICFLI